MNFGESRPSSAPRLAALGSLAAALLALAILVALSPFISVYAVALLGPAAVLLGGYSAKQSLTGAPYRKIAMTGLFLGLIVVVLLAVFLITGTFSESSR